MTASIALQRKNNPTSRPLARSSPKKTFTYTDTLGSRSILETNYLDDTSTTSLYTYLDGMDRTMQTRKEAESSNSFSVRDFGYNKRGLLAQESFPYFGTVSAKSASTSTHALYTNYTYDPLGRIGTTTNAVATTTSAYDQWETTITDANGNRKKLINDAYGRLANVVEYDGATYATTTYEWYPDDTLATTTDGDGNVRHFTYDGRGLRLTAQDLHDTADATFGTWTYTYDNAGNLTSQVDPKSQTVNFTYDGLNRVLTENYTGDAGTEIEYDYDDCTNGVSRLCIATSTGAVTTFAYKEADVPEEPLLARHCLVDMVDAEQVMVDDPLDQVEQTEADQERAGEQLGRPSDVPAM